MAHFRCDAGLGGAGEEYQRRIALVLLQRATLQGHRFRMGFEMTDAGKFDDVALALDEEGWWWLIQAKHTESAGKLSGEMLWPDEDKARKKGDFSLFKYLESYCLVEDYWPHGGKEKRFVLFTNRELDFRAGARYKIGTKDLFEFGSGVHVKLHPDDELLGTLEDFVNRDFESVRSAIWELFNGGGMKPVLKEYKTPLSKLFSMVDGTVKFADIFSESDADPRMSKLYSILKKDFENKNVEISTVSIDASKMEDFWTGKSRYKMLPPAVDRTTVERFFEELILATSQPNVDELLQVINEEWRLWMRSWIRPDDFGRLSTTQLEQPFNTFKKSFHEWEKSTSASKERKFLDLQDGQRLVKSVEGELGDFVRNCTKQTCLSFLSVERFFIHRQIDVVKSQMHTGIDEYALNYKTVTDTDFVDQLYTTFENQHTFVLIAEPGMGKSILWQYLAFYAQQIYPKTAVFLLYMNNWAHELPPAESLDDVLNVLETDLSAESLAIFRNDTTNILLFLDAFDELCNVNLERVLNYVTILLRRGNLKILINSRQRVKNVLEKTLKVTAMKLEPFDERSQIEFLRKFWSVPESESNKFKQFVNNLLDKFHKDIQRRRYDFTGLPLMIKMLGEIYSESYSKFVQSEHADSLEPLTVVDLYRMFTEKCIKMTITKKMNVTDGRTVPYFEEIAEFCQHDYQLVSIYTIFPETLLSAIVDKNSNSRMIKFMSRIAEEETILVEVIAGSPQFIHLSYAEYFCARYLYEFLANSSNPSHFAQLADFLANHDVIRNFFLAMINSNSSANHFNFIQKIGDQAAFWSCQGDYIYLITFLKQYHNFGKIRQTLPDWTFLLQDDETTPTTNLLQQCCHLGGSTLGPSMLHLAVEYDALETLQLLFDARVDVNVRDFRRATPLHYACRNGSLTIVEELIRRGAKVNAVDVDGYTALHLAAYEGHAGIVRCLMANAAKVDGLSRFGESPRALAEKQGHKQIIELLERKGN